MVVHATVTWTHEKAGLLEPADRTPEVRAINRKDLIGLPVHIPNPAWNICGISIRWIRDGISIRGEASLTGRKLFEIAERNP